MSSSKLHWHGDGRGNHWGADSLFEIHCNLGAIGGYRLSRTDGLGGSSVYRTVREAKAAAQAEWEKMNENLRRTGS